MQLPIYFFGDNHFSPVSSPSNEKNKKMKEFLDSIEYNSGSVFIMGDFFDYYFEYKKIIPIILKKFF